MKLLILSHPCVTSTNQAFFAEVERRTGWELTILAPSSWKGEYGLMQLERWPDYKGALLGVPVLLSGNIPLHLYRTFFIGHLRELQPDVIFVHHEPYAAATAQLYLANSLSVKKPIGFFSWQNIKKRFPFPFEQSEKMVFRNSSFAFPGSESAAQVLRDKGYDGPITLLPAGIDPDRYRPFEEVGNVREQLGAHSDEVLIGYLGRIEKAKGLATLLQALAQVKIANWKLAVIGEGAYASELTELVEKLNLSDRFQLRSYVPHEEAPKYLSAFDILVLPSETQKNWKEQFGRVIIEAMACGTPVVGSDSGEISYLIERTEGGMVFPEGSAPELATALDALASDPNRRSALASQGRAYVLDNYTDEHLAAQFCETVEAVSRPDRFGPNHISLPGQ